MSWQGIRGRDDLIRQFRSALERGRLAHAYLFVGPAGVGKRTFARALAKSLLCESSEQPLTACGRCPACRMVDADTHPDFRNVSKPEDKQEFPIAVMRDVLAGLGLKPTRGSRKVLLIEDADDFNEESANAFLKTLEEPPPGSLLILRATSAESQLRTILSRCQPIMFAPLAAADVRAILDEKGIGTEAERGRLVELGGGSIGRAIAMADPALAELYAWLASSLAAAQFDGPRFIERWLAVLESAGKDAARQRERATLALQLLIDLLRRALRAALEAEPADLPTELAGFARRAGPDRLLEMLDICLTADRHVEQRVNLPITVELLADRLTAA